MFPSTTRLRQHLKSFLHLVFLLYMYRYTFFTNKPSRFYTFVMCNVSNGLQFAFGCSYNVSEWVSTMFYRIIFFLSFLFFPPYFELTRTSSGKKRHFYNCTTLRDIKIPVDPSRCTSSICRRHTVNSVSGHNLISILP